MGDFFKIRLKNGRKVALISYVGMLGVFPLYYLLCCSSIAPLLYFSLLLLALLYLLPFCGIRAYYKGHDTTFSLLSMLFLFFWVVILLFGGMAGFREPYNPIWRVYTLSLLLGPFLLAYFSMDERTDGIIYIKLSSCYSGYFSFVGLFLFVYDLIQ